MIGRLLRQGLVQVRVELAAGLAGDLLEAAAAQQVDQLLAHQLHALGHLRLLVMLGGVERPLQVVEHGQQLGHQRLGGAGGLGLSVAGDPLAVVVEVGRDAAQVGQVLVGRAPGLLELGLDHLGHVRARGLGARPRGCGIGPRAGTVLGHARSPASSTTSASTISSSPSAAVPSSPAAPDGASPACVRACS